MRGTAGRWTVIYDGACSMCQRSVSQLRSWDTRDRLELVPYQADGVRQRFPDIPVEDFETSVQLVAPGGERWQGADALEQVLSLVPRGRWVSWAFRVPFARPLARRVYRWVARNRNRLGCGDHCAAP